MPRDLVVEDETDAVELLREFLTAKGYEGNLWPLRGGLGAESRPLSAEGLRCRER